jgi:hypothetical protein
MTTVYTTETPLIAPAPHSFDYATKRSAYVDGCYACLDLNQAAKTAPDNYRHFIYRLKNRWIEMLYRKGLCVQAYEDRGIWQLVFLVDGIRFQWHLPDKVVTWPMKENHSAVFYEWCDDLPRRSRPLGECIALLEWILS